MGAALARGVLAAGVCRPGDIVACDRLPEVAEKFAAETGTTAATDAREVAARSEAVVLCVKPDDVGSALAECDLDGKLLISIAAGVNTRALQQAAGPACRVVRVMPNTAVLVQKGASAYAAGEGTTPADTNAVEKIFGAVGEAFPVKEDLLDSVTGLSGSGPAYVYLFIEALSDGGVQMGLPRDLATKLAVQTVAGAGEMARATAQHPAVLREMVTSPGGTTIAGLAELERSGLRAGVMRAVRAATLRSKELGQTDAGK